MFNLINNIVIMKSKLDKYFKDQNYQLFSACFKVLDKYFKFNQIDLKQFNRLYEQFIKQINK